MPIVHLPKLQWRGLPETTWVLWAQHHPLIEVEGFHPNILPNLYRNHRGVWPGCAAGSTQPSIHMSWSVSLCARDIGSMQQGWVVVEDILLWMSQWHCNCSMHQETGSRAPVWFFFEVHVPYEWQQSSTFKHVLMSWIVSQSVILQSSTVEILKKRMHKVAPR
jgi:hypothetical protein